VGVIAVIAGCGTAATEGAEGRAPGEVVTTTAAPQLAERKITAVSEERNAFVERQDLREIPTVDLADRRGKWTDGEVYVEITDSGVCTGIGVASSSCQKSWNLSAGVSVLTDPYADEDAAVSMTVEVWLPAGYESLNVVAANGELLCGVKASDLGDLTEVTLLTCRVNGRRYAEVDGWHYLVTTDDGRQVELYASGG
jgi:hypothetical protein